MRRIPVGSDLVEVAEDHIVIHARHPFPDWRIREFCRPPIYFMGQKFFLRNRRASAAPYVVGYELEPWPEDLHDESPASVHYNEALVAERDDHFRTERRRSALWYVLLPLYPFLGLCWSGFKEKVLWPIGFVPASITSASIMLVFCALFLDALFLGYLGGGVVIAAFGIGAFGGWVFLGDLALIALLALDCASRFSRMLRDEPPVPDGFLEWLIPRRGQPG